MSDKKSSANTNVYDILLKWKYNPLTDPYTEEPITEVSIHPTSKYVKIYKKVIDVLINYIIANKRPSNKQLTIEDCKHIKDWLPFIHTYIEFSGKVITYDHLFIKYFIKKEKKYNYDKRYKEDIYIFLYLNVFNSIKHKLRPLPIGIPLQDLKNSSVSFEKNVYKDVKDLLVKGNINIYKSRELSISRLIERLCKDIKKILYTHPSKTTKTDFDIVLKNLKILKYASSIYKLCELEDVDENKNKMVAYFIGLFTDKSRLDPKNENHFIDYIFLQIIIFLIKLSPEDDYKNEHISRINILYEDNSVDIKRYLEQFERKSYKDIFIILEKIYIKIIYLYMSSNENTFSNEYTETILSTLSLSKDGALALLSTLSKKVILPTLSLSKEDILALLSWELLDINDKKIILNDKHSYTRILPQNINKTDGKNGEAAIQNKNINEQCGIKWIDAISFDNLVDLSYAQKKYITIIDFYDKEENMTRHHCFDTMSIYNHIIECIEITDHSRFKEPYNPLTKVKLTKDEIVMICNNVLKLINYNKNVLSISDQKILLDARLIKHKYRIFNNNGFLILRSNENDLNEEDGIEIIEIHLTINLDYDNDDLQFPLLNNIYNKTNETNIDFPNLYDRNNSVIMRLPLFKDKFKDDRVDDLIVKIIEKLASNKLLFHEEFPYRNPNREGTTWNSISTLPKFEFSTEEDPEKLFKRVLEYENKYLS